MQLSLIALGFLAGMGHALEPDHLAAVGAMATGRNSRRSMVLRGAAWGLGHTLTLLAICSAVILLGMALTGRTAALLESAVGFMLILLGGDVLWRMRKARVHFHLHDHSDGERHFHAHSHLGERAPHDASRHEHSHPHKFPLKALAVGLVHGAAGSAALLTLAVASVGDPLLAVIYVLLFGVGSIAGMAALSFVASWPLGYAERVALRLHRALNLSLAVLALGLGLHTIYANLPGVLGGGLMHELSLARNIVAIVGDHAQGRRVSRVRLAVGPYACVEREAIRFSFEVASEGTLLEKAALEFLEGETDQFIIKDFDMEEMA